MPVVISTLPKSHYDRYGFEFPPDWEIRYVSAAEEAMIEEGREADIIHVGAVDAVSAEVIKQAAKVRLIQSLGVGFNRIDYEFAAEQGIPVCNNQGANAGPVAEFTVGMMISALRRMTPVDRDIKGGRFAECMKAYWARGVDEISSQKIGLIGCGAIGRNVARLLLPFGCPVFYYDAYRPAPDLEKELKLTYLELDDLIRQCDIISLHVPVLPHTLNMISKPQLEMMKPNAILINTSRGEVLDQAALAEALEAGRIYGAAIDTLSPEPPEADHPLLNLSPSANDRLLVTPHVAGTTNQAFQRMLAGSLSNMKKVLAGEQPDNIVNNVRRPRWL